MKKLLLIAAVAALAMNVALSGQSITVTSPHAGDPWCLGGTYTITWTKSGTMPATVSIKLRRAGSPDSEASVETVTNSTPNPGSVNWVVPASVPADDYFIRVRASATVFGDSGNFHISACAPPASITVTAPNGAEWTKGSAYTIMWTKSGTMPATVAIKLRQAGAPDSEASVETVTNSTANDGSSDSWTIPGTVPVGNYFIRVKTSSPDVIGNSVNFHIKEAGSTIPGDWWRHRLYYKIGWPRDPNPPCLCPDFDIRGLLEIIKSHPEFKGSISLLKNGLKLQELGTIGRGITLPNTLSAKLNRENFNALKNGSAKFSIAILDANGKILNESELQGGQQEVLR